MDLIELAKGYYRAYETARPRLRGKQSGGRISLSPARSTTISGAQEYFHRCWPKEPLHQKFDFVTVMQDGDKVFVAYDANMRIPNAVHPDARFRNAELMTFRERQAEKGGGVLRRPAARPDPPGIRRGIRRWLILCRYNNIFISCLTPASAWVLIPPDSSRKGLIGNPVQTPELPPQLSAASSGPIHRH